MGHDFLDIQYIIEKEKEFSIPLFSSTIKLNYILWIFFSKIAYFTVHEKFKIVYLYISYI